MTESAPAVPESAPPGAPFALPPERVAAIVREKLCTFTQLYPRVLPGDDAEAVHDFRVASRRLQQALDFLHPPAAGSAAKKLRRTVRRARRAACDLRNHDVVLLLLHRLAKRTRSRPRLEVLTATIAALTRARVKTLDRSRRDLIKLRLDRFFLQTGEVLAAGAAAKHLSRRGAEQLADRWEVFSTATRALTATPDPEHLHQTRIAGKKLRYLVELLEECGLPDADAILKWVRKVQTSFGDWLDEGMLKGALVAMIPNRLDQGRILLTLIQQSDRRAQKLLTACLARLTDPEMDRVNARIAAAITRLNG